MMALVAGGNEIREGFGVESFEPVVIPLSRVKRVSKGEGIKEGRRRRLMMEDEIHVSVVVGAVILSEVVLNRHFLEGNVDVFTNILVVVTMSC